MTTNEQFRRAMDAYDQAARHSDGILAVMALVKSETKAEVEGDIERYPLADRVKDQAALRKLSDEDADRWRVRCRDAEAKLSDAQVVITAMRARLDELDAKRS